MGKRKKIPTLYASNVQVKEVYQLTRQIDAMADNISDWREEMYCERPGFSVDVLRKAMLEGNQSIHKWNKKLELIETRLSKTYGRDVLREMDFLFRFKNFGRMKYTEKRKIKLNNFL
jgi:hypothetical protein